MPLSKRLLVGGLALDGIACVLGKVLVTHHSQILVSTLL
jgi:hypothetical protein